MRFPSHPVKLESEAFLGCADLRDITIPEWAEDIPDGFLSACEHLTTVRLEEGLKRIGEGSFLLCEALAEVNFPSTLEFIDNIGFFGTALQQVILPEATKSLGMAAFGGCPNLTRIEVPNPAVSGDAFFSSDPEIGEQLFGDDVPCQIREGYLAKGAPDDPDDPFWKWYALLWATAPGRHSEAVARKVLSWVSEHESPVMDLIFTQQNVDALRTLVERDALVQENLEEYRERAVDIGNPELTALLLSAEERDHTVNLEEEFAL